MNSAPSKKALCEPLSASLSVTFYEAVTLEKLNVTAKCHRCNIVKLNALHPQVTLVTFYIPKKVNREENIKSGIRNEIFYYAYIGLFKFENVTSLMSRLQPIHNSTHHPLNI